jgi:hypothetical protein
MGQRLLKEFFDILKYVKLINQPQRVFDSYDVEELQNCSLEQLTELLELASIEENKNIIKKIIQKTNQNENKSEH